MPVTGVESARCCHSPWECQVRRWRRKKKKSSNWRKPFVKHRYLRENDCGTPLICCLCLHRRHQDEDVIQAQHRMAHNGPLFSYYIIPLSWLKMAWGSLTGVRSKDGIPKIGNVKLAQKGTTKLQPLLENGVDFVLVGSNVWLLLHQKFGYDIELPVQVSHDANRDPRWWFSLPDHVIPFRGRFPYEQYVRDDAVVSDEDTELEDQEEEEDLVR